MPCGSGISPRRAWSAALILGFSIFGLVGCGGGREPQTKPQTPGVAEANRETAGKNPQRRTDRGGDADKTHASARIPESDAEVFERPLAVMIDNAPAARPQSGLSKADAVVEAPAEGGVPRFMAIFVDGNPDIAIGPIRSARPYFIRMAEEIGASYVHCGGSPEALSMLADGADVMNVDEFKAASEFYRDKSRKAPHNLYSTLGRLAQVSRAGGTRAPTEMGHVFEPVSGASAGDAFGTWEPCAEVSVRFNSSHTVTYRYDEQTRTYARFTGSEQDIDRVTGDRIRVRNIVVREVEAKATDGVGRLEIGLVGEGSGYAFTLGRYAPINWRKRSESAQTEYLTDDGNLALPAGNTWIEVISKGAQVMRKD